MYLKSLQVIGFKSFADRTTLHFHPGVTAIVGPNGCGKSNVLDAIRWVLGEQSAKALRGGAMQDVIFSGTESRKALAMAEVSLTFGDCEQQLGVEYNEVTITRRVFRDGASDYELNKTTCRLRDIHQLFMDTGIGRTAYSIMEQGKIDQILSSRPEDRRAIFEEAAGITKYKSQKKEALRKLEHTEANLIRIADIIREVKRQIGSLQRQAGKARRYQAARDELLLLENKLARRQFDQFQGEIDGLTRQVEEGRSTQENLAREVESKDETLKAARVQLEDMELELNRLRDEANECRNAIELAVQHRQTNEARVAEFNELRDRCHLEVAATGEKIKAQEEQLAHLNERLEQSTQQRRAIEQEYEQRQEAAQMLNARIGSVEAERAETEERRLAFERQIQHARNQLAALELQQKNYLFRVESLKQEVEAVNARADAARAELETQTLAVGSAEEKLSATKSQLEQLRTEEQIAQREARELEKNHRDLARRRQSVQARREALQQLVSSHAGTPPAAQEILQNAEGRGLTGALRGTLGDHFRVKPGFEKAAAALIGEAINALLVDNRAAAEQILSILKEGDAARGQISPLDLPRPVPPPPAVETSAWHAVEADPFVQPVLLSLLADAHIVDDLGAAWTLRQNQPQAVVATRDGELITRAGLIVVGTQENDSLALFRRQAEIRQLDADIAPLEVEEHTLTRALQAAQERVETMGTRLAEAQAARQAAEIEQATSRHAQGAAQRALQELERQQESSTREINRLAAQDEVDHEKQAQAQAALVENENALAAARQQEEALSAQLSDLAEEEAETTQALTSHQIQLATQTQQCESWEQQREPVAGRLIELREIAETRAREAVDYEKRIVHAREEIAASEIEQASRQEILERKREELAQGQARRAETQQSIETREAELREARRELAALNDARSAQELKLAERKLFLDHLRERMRRDYQIELESLPELTEEEIGSIDWTQLEEQAKEKRAALDAMGPVNLEAIAEYDELEQRHLFLETQQTDLINSKDQLTQAINEINQTTQKLFAETFEQVRLNFQEMFTELFGGGKANLVLVDDKDPLECGIDIVARPPGKQLQSVTLLSGGEKTMTAVALLFAIYLVKPSPFCVLDEMDAPLDESNINRFIKILQRFVHQSQFVVITHNKRTISVADVLYGVTMEEQGVSKIVSVKLNRGDDVKIPHTPVAVDPAVPSIAESFGKMTEASV